MCHYRGDQELPSFAERNLSFPDEKKNIRRVRIPMIWGGRTVFFAPPMGCRFEAAPSDDGLLLLFVCGVCGVVPDVRFLSPLPSNSPHLWRILVSRQYERESPCARGKTQIVLSRDRCKNIRDSL